MVLGEVELEKWPVEQIKLFEKTAEVRRPVNYLELLEELSTAGVFVGNDSGPGHLAGAIGVPSVVLFGPTKPDVWRPLGPRVTTIHKDPITEITVEAVISAMGL